MSKSEALLALFDLAKTALGTVSAVAPALVLALRRRGKQNRSLAEFFAKEVEDLRKEVKKVHGEQEHLQALTAIHTERMNESNVELRALRLDLDELKKFMPQIGDLNSVMSKVLNYFERKKAAPLEEKSLPGGMVAIKKKEESKK
jgi:hypothetical protein